MQSNEEQCQATEMDVIGSGDMPGSQDRQAEAKALAQSRSMDKLLNTIDNTIETKQHQDKYTLNW